MKAEADENTAQQGRTTKTTEQQKQTGRHMAWLWHGIARHVMAMHIGTLLTALALYLLPLIPWHFAACTHSGFRCFPETSLEVVWANSAIEDFALGARPDIDVDLNGLVLRVGSPSLGRLPH